MSWTKVIAAGVVGGVVVAVANFIMHGFIMAATYMKYEVFDVEPANPVWFFVIPVLMGIPAAAIFGKTRSMWADGIAGGLTFGFWVGMISFFAQFYNPLVVKGFPYYLSWCWGGISLIGFLVFGVVIGLIYKR